MKSMIYRAAFLFCITLMATITRAQDEKKLDVDINVNKDSGATWYMQPWVWVLAAAVFILLLAAVLKGSRKEA